RLFQTARCDQRCPQPALREGAARHCHCIRWESRSRRRLCRLCDERAGDDFLPRSVSLDKRANIAGWGARSVITGEDWDDSNRAALQFAADEGFVYIHPFADPHVIAGQGNVALEILDDAPDLDTLLVAIGGGGLISGIAIAAKALKPAIRIIRVEPTGAPTLHASLAAGCLVELARLDTAAVTLAPRRSESLNLAIVTQAIERIVLVEDPEMAAAARWLWRGMGVAAELSGAAAVAAILAG